MNEPEYSLVKYMMEKGLTVSSAESCSGGLLAHRITNVPGSSACFLGGVVSYSNDAKERLLGVPHGVLSAHGAVSEAVAQAMAESARKVFGTDHAVGVTGIAGPAGGTAEKPVGLVYIAVAGPHDTIVTKNFFTGTREAIKEQTADAALELLLEQLR
jgi:PncC family amidohydrolase